MFYKKSKSTFSDTISNFNHTVIFKTYKTGIENDNNILRLTIRL